MLDINFVRENPDLVRKSEKKRDHDPKLVDEVLKSDLQWRKQLKVMEQLKHTRNVVSQEINQAKKNKKESEAKKKIKEMKSVVEDLKKSEEKVNKLLKKRNDTLKLIGNVLHESVPKGKDDSENVELRKWGKILKFDFPIKDHIELAEELDLIDLDTAAKVSGARFYYLKNEAVLLSQALQRFAIDKMREKGYTLIQTPFMLNRGALEGGVNLSEFEDTIYKIEGEDLYLIATSEHPLIALKKDELLNEKDLPIQICGVSACFRKELGTHGRDDKGIFRVHQFNKVEQIIYCLPEESKMYFDMLQANSEGLFKELGLPFRVVNICTGDIGNKQSLQNDIEAWFPGQNGKKGTYREVTSCSNCLDYQAVTLNTRVKRKDGTKQYVHLLNNTALTDTRPIAAILENFQTAKGTVKIPKALWPYMGGIKEIKRKK
ncbi:serine--tRNA ligase [Candidatus Woesearchaeota archaeon]|jgi:seryl-tRNA synthetase|nr:serine--tRNA ligase [Candidatus Woesearchaeota archaeon]MBT4111141.1 serine--tRNA ligase [Candidatus Woesearchaeota archaeon]MBT4336512.1 serine--tRNA ligase [Candidatus Woesearchaeota archaeon]MBT4469390.1 serine--tRNA ligase [Candidatus Woesearchaeota archaeon]MBT6744215.1 serine--tRNA ligase [Candidatus Woesearchaeota archaeon]